MPARLPPAPRLPPYHPPHTPHTPPGWLCCRLPWLGILYMGCGVTNGGLIMEVIALQVGCVGGWCSGRVQRVGGWGSKPGVGIH